MAKAKKKWYLTVWGIVAILCFWPFITTYFIIKYVARNGRKTPTSRGVPGIISPQDVNVSFSVSDESGIEYVDGMQTISKNTKYDTAVKLHLTKIVAFYKQYATQYDMDKDPKEAIIKRVCPGANSQTCPYCGVIHDFKASRARRCPDCGKQMIVRSSLFLTEQQAEDVDKKITEHYERSNITGQLKHGISEIQDYAMRGNYGQAFLRIATAYQQCAIIHNIKYEKGYTNWDFSWQVLNREALDYAMLNTSSTQGAIGGGYTDVLFARGKHALQQLKYTEDATGRNKHARIAVEMFYNYLVDLAATGLTDWQREDAIKWIALARDYAKLNGTLMSEIESGLAGRSASKASQRVVDGVVEEVHGYVFMETDPERMRQMIY